MTLRTGLWPVLFLCAGFFQSVQAEDGYRDMPAISIIIDDMGKRLESGHRVLALPGPVACAFLPRAQHTDYLARQAHAVGREILLHLPMDSVDGRRLDAGAVTLDMTERQFAATVVADLAAVPHVSGINNHMGSLLTRHPGHMLWLMRVMQQQAPLFFIDSRTTVATVARRVAMENAVPNMERNVFLDNEPGADAIAFQFERLLRLAEKQGTALAIGHPHPQTLAFLEQRLPRLGQRGLRLLPVRDLIDIQQQGENTWQASWSPSRRGAKN
ncbi:MAG: divergent polysaccharide deacetylase family protein [Thiogranum sp.]